MKYTRLLCLFSFLFFLFSVDSQAVESLSLKIKGVNFQIKNFTTGASVFMNRPAMSYLSVPTEFAGWKYTLINANNSTYLPGPLPEYSVQSTENGFIYVLVEDQEKPEVVAKWAVDYGWTKETIKGIAYGTKEFQTTYFYKKEIKGGTWIEIVQPDVFSGAILLAPSLEKATGSTLSTAPVSVLGNAAMETGEFASGALAFMNRAFVFENVPEELTGLIFTRYNGGGVPDLEITAQKDGNLYVAVSSIDNQFDVKTWQQTGLSFNYNDGGKTGYKVYYKTVRKEDKIKIETDCWTGVMLLSHQIDYVLDYETPQPPGVIIMNSKANTRLFVGSPSIAIMPDGSYMATFDFWGSPFASTYVFKSEDKGATWKQISTFPNLNWATIFNRGKELYLIGIRARVGIGYGDMIITRSKDGGKTWTQPKDANSGLLKQGYYHCAPVPVVFHKGRIWRAMENQGSAGGWGPFSSFMISIPENENLIKAQNWTMTNEIKYETAFFPNTTAWLEGNAVVTPSGEIWNMLRVQYNADSLSAVVRISEDGKTSTFNPRNGYVTFPGGGKKFTIRYDSVSQKYWSLTNYVLEKDRNNDNGATRNTVTLIWSADLEHWHIKDTLLYHPDRGFHGFQYLDWLVDGNDLVAVSRTAYDDETGLPPRQHDANYITFHRFENFRKGLPTSGVSATKTPLDFSVSLNADRTFLRVQLEGCEKTDYRIIDTQGRDVRKGILNAQELIDVSALPAGCYVIVVPGAASKKWIK